MSYLSQAQNPRRRIVAITSVAAIHAAIGLGLIVGLTVSGLLPEKDRWDPFTVTPDAQPKPPPPAPQPTQQSVVTIPPTPLPPLGTSQNTIVPEEVVDRSTVVAPIPAPSGAPVPDTLPATLFTPRRAVPVNDSNRWITTDDYPSRPLRDEIEGTGAYRLIVGTNGRVSACDVTRSTGNGQLDAATCRFITQRARFEAATDQTGAKVMGNYTGTVRWEIPD